jgi:acetoin utilization protein AcuB
MLVQDVMRRDLVVATSETTLSALASLLQRRGIRHLLVVDEGRLVGIISDRDLKGAIASTATGARGANLLSQFEGLTAADIMTRSVVTTAPMFPVEEAAALMVTKRISALPVTQEGRLVGIVTDTDVLQLFVRAMGVAEPSSRLDVTLDRDGHGFDRIVHAVERAGGPISSIMTLRSPTTDAREAVIRLATINPGPAIKALEAEGFAVRDSWRV